MSRPPGSPRLSSTGRASCSRVKTRSGPSAVTRSRSGMRRPSSGMALAEVVVNVQTGHHRGEPLARLVHAEQLGHGVAQGSVRSSVPRSATCAMVLCSTRAPTGCRSAW